MYKPFYVIILPLCLHFSLLDHLIFSFLLFETHCFTKKYIKQLKYKSILSPLSVFILLHMPFCERRRCSREGGG